MARIIGQKGALDTTAIPCLPCAGKEVYAPRYHAEWLGKISEPVVRRRAEFYYTKRKRGRIWVSEKPTS